jgi:hypothetical protein
MHSEHDLALDSEYELDKDTGTKWISDTNVFEDALKYSGDVVIQADPGTGKSYAALKQLGAPEHPFIFVADTIASAEDLGSEHDLPVYYKDQPAPPDMDFITIPHHAHKDRFVDSDIHLVVDEWHSLLADYDFKETVIDNLVQSFSEFKQIIGLTGTYLPVPHPHKHVKVSRNRDDIPVTIVSYNHLWSAIVEQVEARPDRTHFISLYDKSTRLKNLRALLEARGFEAGEIMPFNADTTDRGEVQNLMKQNMTRDDTKVIISTYVQGFSIKDTDYMVHIAPLPGAQHSPTDIAQVAQRFRNETDLPINLYWNFPAPDRISTTGRRRYLSRQGEIADRQIRQYRTDLNLSDEEAPTSNQKSLISSNEKDRRKDREDESDEVNLVRDDLTRNEYQIHHNVYAVVTENIYKERKHMERWLNRYELTVQAEEACPITLPEAEESSTSGTETVQKEEFMERVEEHLERDYIPQYDEAGEKILFLLQYYNDEEDIRTILKEHGKPTRTWNRLKRSIEAQALQTEAGEETRDRVYRIFDVGERLTNEEIQARMDNIEFEDRDSSKLTTQEAVKYLRRYVEAKRTSMIRDGDKVTVYEIISEDPLPVPIPEDSKKPIIGENTIRLRPRMPSGQ